MSLVQKERIVALFWEAGELVIPSHVQSKFLGLDKLRPGGVIPYGSMIRALRSDPDFRVNYRDARFDYQGVCAIAFANAYGCKGAVEAFKNRSRGCLIWRRRRILRIICGWMLGC